MHSYAGKVCHTNLETSAVTHLYFAAIQAVSKEEEGGHIAFWSESHVSEDFDISLRLQVANNIVILASYHN